MSKSLVPPLESSASVLVGGLLIGLKDQPKGHQPFQGWPNFETTPKRKRPFLAGCQDVAVCATGSVGLEELPGRGGRGGILKFMTTFIPWMVRRNLLRDHTFRQHILASSWKSNKQGSWL